MFSGDIEKENWPKWVTFKNEMICWVRCLNLGWPTFEQQHQ